MVEAGRKRELARRKATEVSGLELPAGKVQGLWQRWVEHCPLAYTSPNAPSREDALGTWLLSILAGHNRYAHVTGLRNDGVNPGLLGMTRVISPAASCLHKPSP